MKKRSGPVLGSNAKRNGLRKPQANSSWQLVVGVEGRLPRTRQLADPGPLIGLPGAGSPVEGTPVEGTPPPAEVVETQSDVEGDVPPPPPTEVSPGQVSGDAAAARSP